MGRGGPVQKERVGRAATVPKGPQCTGVEGTGGVLWSRPEEES